MLTTGELYAIMFADDMSNVADTYKNIQKQIHEIEYFCDQCLVCNLIRIKQKLRFFETAENYAIPTNWYYKVYNLKLSLQVLRCIFLHRN